MADKISTIVKDLDKELYKTTLGEDNDLVIIGDELDDVAFKNKIKFTRWNGEESLTIDFNDVVAGNPFEDVDGKTKIKKSDNTIGFYYDRFSDDTLKFGLILNYTPKNTQKWTFKLAGGWENFDYFYQPPLKNVNPDGSTWEDTETGHHERPVEVNGSWAIYHKWKANYIKGGINYAVGKFGHFYRPRLLDADNNFLGWVDLKISDGLYNISIENIPQEILDKAVLPLKFNDTLGTTTVGLSSWSTSFVIYIQGTTSAGGGTIGKIYAYLAAIGGDTGKFKGAAYTDSSTSPSALVANSGTTETAGFTTFAWQEGTPTGTATLLGSTAYWVACAYSGVTSAENISFRYDSGSSVTKYLALSVANYNAFPQSTALEGLGTEYSNRYSFYLEYTAGGGGTPTGFMTCNSKFW